MAEISLTWQEAKNIEIMTNIYLYGQNVYNIPEDESPLLRLQI
jgi:hypothetical protein